MGTAILPHYKIPLVSVPHTHTILTYNNYNAIAYQISSIPHTSTPFPTATISTAAISTVTTSTSTITNTNTTAIPCEFQLLVCHIILTLYTV